jgi:DNA invertase Pin-like site-specific DNA recombinase
MSEGIAYIFEIAFSSLLLAIYSYFAEAEREYISLRTKQGLASAKAQGKHLGRPKGSKNKERVLDPYRDQIKQYLQLELGPDQMNEMI